MGLWWCVAGLSGQTMEMLGKFVQRSIACCCCCAVWEQIERGICLQICFICLPLTHRDKTALKWPFKYFHEPPNLNRNVGRKTEIGFLF